MCIGVGHEGQAGQTEDVCAVPATAAIAAQVAVLDAAHDLPAVSVKNVVLLFFDDCVGLLPAGWATLLSGFL